MLKGKISKFKEKNRLGINYVYNLSYQILSMIIPLITTPYLSRVLGTENIGIYSYVASVTAYFTLFSTFGFHTYGQRQLAYDRDNRESCANIFFEIMTDKLIFTVIAAIAYAFVIVFAGNEYRPYFISSGLLIISTFFDFSWFFQGLENFRMIFVRSLILKITGLIFIFAFVKTDKDLTLYILADAGANLLGNLSMMPAMVKYLRDVRPGKISIKNGMKTSAELFVPMVAIYAYSLADRTMLGLTGNKAESGVYEQAHKILRLLEMVLVSLSTVLIPRISYIYKNEGREKVKTTIDNSYRFVIFLGMPICFGLFAAADNLVPWFFGSGYDKVAFLLKMSSPIIPIIGMANIAGNAVLIPIEEHNKTTVATITGAVVNIILNSVWIGVWFSTGAMAASIISEVLVCVIEMFFARKYFNPGNIVKYILQSALFSALMYLTIRLADSLTNFDGIIKTFIQIAVGMLVYGALFGVFIGGSEKLYGIIGKK